MSTIRLTCPPAGRLHRRLAARTTVVALDGAVRVRPDALFPELDADGPGGRASGFLLAPGQRCRLADAAQVELEGGRDGGAMLLLSPRPGPIARAWHRLLSTLVPARRTA